MSLHRRHLLLASLPAALLSPRARAAGAPPKRWIVVLLRGAIDGLSVCAPYAEADYARERPGIALPPPGQEGGLLDLDGRFGLHPALAPLQPLWAAGQFGFVQACGAPTSSRSHFEAQDELETGTPGVKTTPDGWLARLLEGDQAGVQAVYTAPTRPKLLSGPASARVAALPGATRTPERPALGAALDRLYAQDPRYAATWQAAQSGRSQMAGALEAGQGMNGAMTGGDPAADRGAPGANTLPATARRLAQVLRADPTLRFACVELGGWDTHARQGAAQGQLAGRLAPLGQGLATLAQSLGPLWADTVVTVISEFGRTVAENGTGGTDHGHGNALWLLGGAVRGGQVLGAWPGLESAARFQGRDLAVTTDYRAVLAGVAAQHLGLRETALATLFPSYSGGRLPVLRG
ncbi:DUF1501 domain-containing protein [Inhella sp.]|uniref:DUF1501 domain-containing protein n=1 Tax=Inhella sp. TaxID=1921806 RepID=UPI0035B0DCC1